MKWIIAIFVTLLSGVLFFIWGPDEQNLGDNYYYLPKYEAVDIGYPGGSIIYKSAQKYLFSDIKIHGDVISVDHNKDFIIAIQNADSSSVEEKQSSIAEKNSLNYFIIVKITGLIYGPYNYKNYLQKREELGVPGKLQPKKQ